MSISLNELRRIIIAASFFFNVEMGYFHIIVSYKSEVHSFLFDGIGRVPNKGHDCLLKYSAFAVIHYMYAIKP